MKYIVYLRDKYRESHPGMITPIGRKARAIADLFHRGWLVPPGFVITPAAFWDSLTQSEAAALQLLMQTPRPPLNAAHILLEDLTPSEAVQGELLAALADLFPYGGQFAVRSSALDEDGVERSLAGQLTTVLSVAPPDLGAKIAAVWRSAYQESLLLYRQRHGQPGLPQPPAVLIQQMVQPVAAGVAFGADPVTGRRNLIVINALYGLGTRLVSGESEADTFYLNRHGEILQRQIARKAVADRPNPMGKSGIFPTPVPDALMLTPAINDQQAKAIAQLVRRAGQHFGIPQDIEWAITETGQIYLLQSRPITALPTPQSPTGRYQLWDNSNIAESYSGVTTPLTFSFARQAYREVYRQFCRLMGVSQGRILRHETTFAAMIGLIQGRIYYNLLNWYRVLTLLPGFQLNRQFMEQMMGVKETLPAALLEQLTAEDAPNGLTKVQDGLELLRTVMGLGVNGLFLPWRIRRFYRRVDWALGNAQPSHLDRLLGITPPPPPVLEQLPADELVAHYQDLASQLLPRWDAPIINDFLAMIFYGLLGRLTQAWCGDQEGTLQNSLLTQGASPGMISTEPARQLQWMGALAANNQDLVDLLCRGERERILAALPEFTDLYTAYQNYLVQFSDRCLDELKLESPTLADDPLPLLRAIGAMAHQPQTPPGARGKIGEKAHSPLTPPKADSHQRELLPLRRYLRRNPLKAWILTFVLHQARARLCDRENLRFERTRVFGRARRIFLELGKRFFILDVINHPEDIFYLTVEEILGFVQGTAVTHRLKGLVALRRSEFEDDRDSPPPPDRFATYGMVGNRSEGRAERRDPIKSSPITTDDEARQGRGCSPGIVRGVVRVVRDPHREPPLAPGTILVAERTDPGWILLFPAAAGLLVERGSLLSHAAIVTRELGIPAIVSIPGLTQWLQDGDRIEFDGSTGWIQRLSDHP
ncbi:PEP/pyruvate-binding domain-containing protein [Spirulina sp. CCNP1310]|uniref:PEP/pyruvate-binding domain-containing protein n=1 Tax=Spirulina sp. CCNP1310 TaxID=3110249 RepID=UPI002B1EDC37|nr:PEP/pyruvate-binding domain-containing protein [Spirulina sp. CCNP1310]MEA5418656.1 PEP/pyruvate-binding domain-containing protein [Spirulina sp. CCNP1310]